MKSMKIYDLSDMWFDKNSDIEYTWAQITHILFIFKFMKQKTTSPTDFFDRYNRSRLNMYVFPAIFGIGIAFWVVSMSHTGDMRGLMASVAEIAQPLYDADIVMTRTDTGFEILLGKDADAVSTLEFRLLTSPDNTTKFISDIGTLTDEWEGSYLFVRSYAGERLLAGSVIASFAISESQLPIALTDTEMTSGDTRYSLTNKSE